MASTAIISDGFADIVAEGFDPGIRPGEAVQQDMVAFRPAPPFKAIMVASPEQASITSGSSWPHKWRHMAVVQSAM